MHVRRRQADTGEEGIDPRRPDRLALGEAQQLVQIRHKAADRHQRRPPSGAAVGVEHRPPGRGGHHGVVVAVEPQRRQFRGGPEGVGAGDHRGVLRGAVRASERRREGDQRPHPGRGIVPSASVVQPPKLCPATTMRPGSMPGWCASTRIIAARSWAFASPTRSNAQPATARLPPEPAKPRAIGSATT